MRDQLRRYYNYSDPHRYGVDALRSMEEYFPSVIRIASAVSWAAKEKGFIGVTVHSLADPLVDSLQSLQNWRAIKHEAGDVLIDYDVFAAHIKAAGVRQFQLRKSDAEIEDFIDTISNCYLPLINQSNIASVRKLCHGHIGMAFIRLAYAMFIDHFWRIQGRNGDSDPTTNLINMLSLSHWISPADGENSWVQHYAYPSGSMRDSPVYCFGALELLE